MITIDYLRRMARYNAWQNRQIALATETLSPAGWSQDRAGFWGSLGGTLAHLVWGDLTWMARFDGGAGAPCGQAESGGLCPTRESWLGQRRALDGRILGWADGMSPQALAGDLSWYSASAGAHQTRPLGLLIVHFFNHQTHHRGQAHQMLSEAGLTPPVSDLFLMPEPEAAFGDWFD